MLKIFFFEYRKETDIVRIRIENQTQRRSFEFDRVSGSDFIEIWKSEIWDLEKFGCQQNEKNFFSNIETKRISSESESKTKLNAALSSSIESVVEILSKFEVSEMRHLEKFWPKMKNFFFDNPNETDTIRTGIENQTQKNWFEFDRVGGSDFIAVWSWPKPTLRKISRCQEDVKKFFLNIEMKRISFETESKTKFNAAYLSSIESVVPILWNFENWKSET